MATLEEALSAILQSAMQTVLSECPDDSPLRQITWEDVVVLKNKSSKYGQFHCVTFLKSAHSAGCSTSMASEFAMEVAAKVKNLGEGNGLEFVVTKGFLNIRVNEEEWCSKRGILPAVVSPVTAISPYASFPSFSFREIGRFESCFKERHGTPRQGAAAPDTKGRVRLHPWVIARESFEGIEQYSHVWLVFVFHANTNTKFHPRIRPPRLRGGKFGAYATRTPHRINPIGLTVCKLVEWDGGDLLTLAGFFAIASVSLSLSFSFFSANLSSKSFELFS